MAKHTQYALLDEKGGSATLCHQDDLETPLVERTLPRLIDSIETWSDMDFADTVKEFEPGGEFAGHKIVRQEVETFPLTPEEEAIIAKAVKEDEDDEEWAKKTRTGDTPDA